MAYIFQYYVVVDKEELNYFYEGEIWEILAGPFHSEYDANEWIRSNPRDYGLCVVRARVEVRLC